MSVAEYPPDFVDKDSTTLADVPVHLRAPLLGKPSVEHFPAYGKTFLRYGNGEHEVVTAEQYANMVEAERQRIAAAAPSEGYTHPVEATAPPAPAHVTEVSIDIPNEPQDFDWGDDAVQEADKPLGWKREMLQYPDGQVVIEITGEPGTVFNWEDHGYSPANDQKEAIITTESGNTYHVKNIGGKIVVVNLGKTAEYEHVISAEADTDHPLSAVAFDHPWQSIRGFYSTSPVKSILLKHKKLEDGTDYPGARKIDSGAEDTDPFDQADKLEEQYKRQEEPGEFKFKRGDRTEIWHPIDIGGNMVTITRHRHEGGAVREMDIPRGLYDQIQTTGYIDEETMDKYFQDHPVDDKETTGKIYEIEDLTSGQAIIKDGETGWIYEGREKVPGQKPDGSDSTEVVKISYPGRRGQRYVFDIPSADFKKMQKEGRIKSKSQAATVAVSANEQDPPANGAAQPPELPPGERYLRKMEPVGNKELRRAHMAEEMEFFLAQQGYKDRKERESKLTYRLGIDQKVDKLTESAFNKAGAKTEQLKTAVKSKTEKHYNKAKEIGGKILPESIKDLIPNNPRERLKQLKDGSANIATNYIFRAVKVGAKWESRQMDRYLEYMLNGDLGAKRRMFLTWVGGALATAGTAELGLTKEAVSEPTAVDSPEPGLFSGERREVGNPGDAEVWGVVLPFNADRARERSSKIFNETGRQLKRPLEATQNKVQDGKDEIGHQWRKSKRWANRKKRNLGDRRYNAQDSAEEFFINQREKAKHRARVVRRALGSAVVARSLRNRQDSDATEREEQYDEENQDQR